MAHYGYIEDETGDLVDLIVTCSDSCNRTAHKRVGLEYGGWSGCHELEFGQACENCGVWVPGFEDDICREQMSESDIVARFRVEDTIYCDEHGDHIIQLGAEYLLKDER